MGWRHESLPRSASFRNKLLQRGCPTRPQVLPGACFPWGHNFVWASTSSSRGPRVVSQPSLQDAVVEHFYPFFSVVPQVLPPSLMCSALRWVCLGSTWNWFCWTWGKLLKEATPAALLSSPLLCTSPNRPCITQN